MIFHQVPYLYYGILLKEGQVYLVQFGMANIEGSLVEFGKVAQLLCLEGPIEAVTSSDYANRPPLNYHRCAGTKSKSILL